MENFYSIYTHNLIRTAVCNFPVKLADPFVNGEEIINIAGTADSKHVALCIFPELSLTGYSIEDIRLQKVLLEGVNIALEHICRSTISLLPVLIVGAPIVFRGALYNCAVIIHKGKILGIVPKSYLPNYREFYEARQFNSGCNVQEETIEFLGQSVPFGVDILFHCKDFPDLIIGIEICEDLWVPIPPSAFACMEGATIIANLSASNITIGKAEQRNLLCQSQSMRGICAYLYAAAGEGESSTDVAWDGQLAIVENGKLLAQSDRFPQGQCMVIADVDLDILQQERLHIGTFNQYAVKPYSFRFIPFTLAPPLGDYGLKRPIERFPFVPTNKARLQQDCYEAYRIQISALKQRFLLARAQTMVIGISGGLDSTQALLVAIQVADELNLDRKCILGYTMPGFATSPQTKENAEKLMQSLGICGQCLDIRSVAEQFFKDIRHPYAKGKQQYDITFENVQAGLRTDYLFRLANLHKGIVIGTGDLSELALGWCTYGVGDQMSHYNVNAGLPKTLIQHLIRWVISSEYFSQETSLVLQKIVDTEISPELIPLQDGQSMQSTEEKIGPYSLQDFNLYYVLRYGLKPSKIAFLAYHAWSNKQDNSWLTSYPNEKKITYNLSQIKFWLEVFVERFFGFSQFKRSALPNGPKISSGGSLSPRGEWRAPSDGNASIWIKELRENVPKN